ncbi:hypothetical protein [Nocardia brasiliensis]|uniref:hypothetical protein n=1 Tax=Nocardia brasiliensis TaxID=37326 RepID=UPI0024551F3B|nr:hypothetical protein [Nocardia brasiliensis]
MEILGIALGVVGILVSIVISVWQVKTERNRRRRRKAKKLKADLKAAQERIAELETRSKPKR